MADIKEPDPNQAQVGPSDSHDGTLFSSPDIIKKAYIPPEVIQHKPLKSIMSEKAFAKAT
jgi:hypothetical protein